jgi:hypothetical protein
MENKMNSVQKSLVGASLINTLFFEYKCGELNSSGELVRKRIAKYMKQRSKTNRSDFIIAIKTTDTAWRDAINHFAKETLKIEAKSTIRAIYNYFSDELSKYANVRDEHIEKFLIMSISDAEAEHNSDIVIDYIISQIGLEKRKSLFKTKLAILKQNRILEGK